MYSCSCLCLCSCSLPGGRVEDGELMHEALRLELQEKAGLLVGDPVRTAFLMHIDSEQRPSALAAAFEIDERSRDVAPEEYEIKQAAFFPLPHLAVPQPGQGGDPHRPLVTAGSRVSASRPGSRPRRTGKPSEGWWSSGAVRPRSGCRRCRRG
ncbi:NUDIX domain-containing protein [Streptomyces chattanoogensis]|uniref:NUDIX domain-containing protein n=1 Tax=Streptomyces chattanoogensis TaxID=66876 RepID=UPI00367982EF